MKEIKDVAGKTVRLGDKVSCPTPTGLGDRRKLLVGTVVSIVGKKTVKILAKTNRGFVKINVINFSLTDNSFVRNSNELVHFKTTIEKRDYGFGERDVVVTTCTVSDRDGNALGFGKVILNHSDTNHTGKAYRYALKKALNEDSVSDRASRHQLWKKFGEQLKRKGMN